MKRLNRKLSALVVAAVLLVGALATHPGELHAQDQPTSLNFVNARLSDVIRSLAASIGVNVVLNEIPDRRITFSTTVPVRAQDLGGVLESILDANNLTLVQQGPVAQVFPADSAAAGVIRFGTEPSVPPPLGLVTQLVPLRWIRAEEAAAALKPVASAKARIEPVARSNSLLITDFGSNITRYLELLRGLDERPEGEAGLRTYVVALKYANAEDLAASISQLFGIGGGGARSVSLYEQSLSRNLDIFREREAETYRLRRDALSNLMPTTQLDTTAAGAAPGALIGRTTVVADPPTNSLMIRTAPANYPLLLETIQALDVRPAQVLFEVTVAEISLGKSYEFGIDWAVIGNTAIIGRGTPLPIDTLAVTQDFVTNVVTLDRADVRAVLRALATKFNVRVLSTPEILAVNNREARIVVGSRVPFVASARLGDVAIDRSV
ncbi:MAG: secretin N-terminal domain-containing protein, partial [Longimicrobiales bacterium]